MHKPDDLHADDRDRRDRRQALQASAARRRTNMRCRASSAPPRPRQAGNFDDEIVPVTATMAGQGQGDRRGLDAGGHARPRTRATAPDTTLEGLAKLQAGARARTASITAGNASQLSDGASACVVMDAELAEQARAASRSAIYRGMAVAGCEPDEMGIGPVFAVPQAARAHRPQDRRHRPVGAERGLRGAGALLPRQARHPERQAQRQRRRDLDRPPLRHDAARA